MDVKVKGYIEKQVSPQKEIMFQVRDVFQQNLPNCQEKMTWGVITYGEGKFYLAAMKNCVHVGFSISGLSDEEKKFFDGTGKTMRHIKIFTVENIDKKKLVKLVKLVDKKSTCKVC